MIKYKRPIPISKAQSGQELVYREINADRLHVDPSGYLVDRDGNKYAAAALPKQREQGVVVTRRRIGPTVNNQQYEQNKTNQANAGAIAIPLAGYGVSQLLQGLGSSISLSAPTISGSSVAATTPVALTLAAPAYGLYETITGQHHQIGTTPQQRQNNTYTTDATRVNSSLRRVMPIPIGRKFNLSKVLSLSTNEQPEASADAAEQDMSNAQASTNASNTPPEQEKPNQEKPEQTPSENKPEQDKMKSSWKHKVANKLNNNIILKTLWETKNRNFGELYKLRNAARVGTYIYEGPSILGFGTGALPRYMKYAGEQFEKGRRAAGNDSTNVSLSNKQSTTSATAPSQATNSPDTIKAGTASPTQQDTIQNYTFNPIDNNMFDD